MLIKIDDDRKRLKEIPSSVIGIQKRFWSFVVVISNQNAKILRFFNYFILFFFLHLCLNDFLEKNFRNNCYFWPLPNAVSFKLYEIELF